MLQARDTIHPDGWFGMDRAEWIAAAEEVAGRAETLSDDQRLVELVRLAAMPTWNGRDGHSGIWPFGPEDGTHLYPVRWWRFPEGLVITAARAPYVDLVGARVEAIGGVPIDEVLALVEPLAPRDNPSNLLAFSTLFLRASELLAGLGVIDEAGPTPFTVVGRDGVRREAAIDPVNPAVYAAWYDGLPHRLAPTDAAWLRNQDETLWWTFLEDSGTLFVQFNAVQRGRRRQSPRSSNAHRPTMSSAWWSTCATTAAATTRRSVRSSGRSATRQSTNPAGCTRSSAG